VSKERRCGREVSHGGWSKWGEGRRLTCSDVNRKGDTFEKSTRGEVVTMEGFPVQKETSCTRNVKLQREAKWFEKEGQNAGLTATKDFVKGEGGDIRKGRQIVPGVVTKRIL